jgi:hypothetical protein
MSIAWYCIPSARPRPEANLALSQWRERGYKIALLRESDADMPICDVLMVGPYPGYAAAVNLLTKEALRRDPECQWVVTGGDDIFPDTNSPKDIARECTEHFGGTFGVMQPTGDRWADGSIDSICGSPWLGREWCQRSFGGNGPLWPEFLHMFGDEHLQNVTKKLGILWQRRDLTHLHNHYFRTNGNGVNHGAPIPEHMAQWNTQKHWNESKAIFQRLKAGGFAEANDLLYC